MLWQDSEESRGTKLPVGFHAGPRWVCGRVGIAFSDNNIDQGMDWADREWRLIREEAWDGPMNMALDEVAAESAANDRVRTVRVYQWEPSTLSLGYHQESSTVDWSVCEQEEITVTRRPTGGGGIYHDSYGDISYSIVVPASDLPGDLESSYHELLIPIRNAFSELQLPVEFATQSRPAIYEPACYLRALDPAHDLVVSNKKISGNAQYRQKNAIIQHGSITYDKRPTRHLAVFNPPGNFVTQFDARVTSVVEHASVSRQAVIATIEETLAVWSGATVGHWSTEELEAANRLVETKYADPSWTKRR